MATAAKISVSVPAEDLAWARSQARRRKESVSAVVSRALRLARQLEARNRVLARLPESTPEALAAVDQEWLSD